MKSYFTSWLPQLLVLIMLLGGCSKEYPDQPVPNKLPKTFLWLYPDSTIREGNSRQRVRWWGEDPDGVVRGYLFAAGKLLTSAGKLPNPDTITWRWRTVNDSLMAFPLLVRQDTFQVMVRAVDNSFVGEIPDQAIVRFSPFAYVDKNENQQADPGEELMDILAAADPSGALLGFPILNQPPSIAFAANPNDPSVPMQQPDTTFTAATFSWVGSDPDGDQTISTYEIALNDTAASSAWFTVPGTVKLISLVVPRERSNPATGAVNADVYSGTFASTRRLLGSMPNLKLDTLNTFYVRARDIAGDVSPAIQLPNAPRRWFVKKPHGRLLIVSDYISSDSAAALNFYAQTFRGIAGFSEFEVLNVGRGLSAQPKKESKVGTMVQNFIDPGFLFTLHLFDVVFWFSEQLPSLAVAQYPLFQYVRDPVHPGKVIFSTMFESASDPRGALKDFAPIDSISSVSLLPNRLLPTLGDTRLPNGFEILPVADGSGSAYPSLRVKNQDPALTNVTLFMRPIYKRADARYIYRMQEDAIVPGVRPTIRYVYSATLNDLRAVAATGMSAWTCGVNGIILRTTDGGQSWADQSSATTNSLFAMQLLDPQSVTIAGEDGTILQTSDGGANWTNKSVVTLEDLMGIHFTSATNGIIVGTSGLIIRTTNGGGTWTSPASGTSRTIRSVQFGDANTGIAVGDSGLVLRTSDGGVSWQIRPPITTRRLNAIQFINPTTCFAVGQTGAVVKSTDGGLNWTTQTAFTTVELRSLQFLYNTYGWTSGANGAVFQTTDGGTTWSASPGNPIAQANGQVLNGIFFTSTVEGFSVGTGGIILRMNSGTSWSTVPRGSLNVGVVDGPGADGRRSFVFIGLPLHMLNGDGLNVDAFFRHVLFDEFGL